MRSSEDIIIRIKYNYIEVVEMTIRDKVGYEEEHKILTMVE